MIGPLSGVSKDSLEFFFAELCRGTPAEGAKLEIVTEAAVLSCENCGNSISYDGTNPIELQCLKCGGPNKLQGGTALYLDSIEVEDS